MNARLMLLPAAKLEDMKIVRIPEDFDHLDALRHATSLIATVEEGNKDYDWDEIGASLEDHGFEILDYVVGPVLD